MDEANFTLTVGKWHIVMADGELEIDNCSYDSCDADEDPMYDFVRQLFKLMGNTNEAG